MKRSWLEEETKHRFLAELKFRKVLKARFQELRSELDGNVSQAQLAGEICEYLSCAEEKIWVKRGNKRYQVTAKEVEQRHADLQIEDYNETTSAIALAVHLNFKMIGEWIDGIRLRAVDLGLSWAEAQPMLHELLGRAQLNQVLEPENALVVAN